VECAYDSMGRRAYKKVTVNGSVTLHQRYIYRGYLQIACIDLTRSHHPVMWLLLWDPTQSPRGLGGGLDKPQSEFAPHGVSRQWGADESTRCHPSAGCPNQRHLVHLRLGSHQEHLRALLHRRLHLYFLYLYSLRASNSLRQHHPAHPVELRGMGRGSWYGVL